MGWAMDLHYVSLSRSKVINEDNAYADMGYWMLTARIPIEPSPDNFWPALIRKLQ